MAITYSHGQETNDAKPDVYVYFDEFEDGKVGMFKLDRGVSEDPDIYIYEINASQLLFNTVDKKKYEIVDSCFVGDLNLKSPEWGSKETNYELDLNSVSRKYEHIYFVEKLAENKYKIIEVVPYIGSIFFAPGYPKRKTRPIH